MTLATGDILNNRYRIVSLLGQGGFGAVYRAWDINLNHPCAVKENLETGAAAQDQFVREATVLANLTHAHLPRVTDYFSLAGQGQYLVMDYVEGEDLDSMIQRQGALEPEQAVKWIGEVLDALIYLHGQNPAIIHRDIKPANIRINPSGQALLVDFGLVKLYDPHKRTTMGARAVTAGYSPPEQYGQAMTDPRSDIYAIGATLYMILSGQEPMESVLRITGDTMRPAHMVNTRVPLQIGLATGRAMALNPDNRFQTAADFKTALTTPSKAGEQPMAGARVSVAPTTRLDGGFPSVAAPLPAHPYGEARGSAVARKKSPAKTVAGWLILLSGCVIVFYFLGLPKIGIGKPTATPTRKINYAATTQAAISTGTVKAQREATSRVERTATAKAAATEVAYRATAQAASEIVAKLETNKVLWFNPLSKTLLHDVDGFIDCIDSDLVIKNLVVEARFFNPYSSSTGKWDYGFIFRDEGTSKHFRLIIASSNVWRLNNYVGSSEAQEIDTGPLENLRLGEGESNTVKLVTSESEGWLFVNDEFIDTLDLSARVNAGDVRICTGFVKGNEIAGEETRFEGFTVWNLK